MITMGRQRFSSKHERTAGAQLEDFFKSSVQYWWRCRMVLRTWEWNSETKNKLANFRWIHQMWNTLIIIKDSKVTLFSLRFSKPISRIQAYSGRLCLLRATPQRAPNWRYGYNLEAYLSKSWRSWNMTVCATFVMDRNGFGLFLAWPRT